MAPFNLPACAFSASASSPGSHTGAAITRPAVAGDQPFEHLTLPGREGCEPAAHFGTLSGDFRSLGLFGDRKPD